MHTANVEQLNDWNSTLKPVRCMVQTVNGWAKHIFVGDRAVQAFGKDGSQAINWL